MFVAEFRAPTDVANDRSALSPNHRKRTHSAIFCDTLIYTVSQKSSHLLILCNFFKSLPIFKIFAPLESVWNALQNPNNITHLTLGMLLH